MSQNFYDTLLHEFGNEYLNEFYLAEGLNERLISVVPLEKNEEVINSCDADKFMERTWDTFDDHIDDFIHVGICIWDVGCFIWAKEAT
jgi:hypothetical protein